MTMAKGRKVRVGWSEFLLVAALLFLLAGARNQIKSDTKAESQASAIDTTKLVTSLR
jgi:hypothetical protein